MDNLAPRQLLARRLRALREEHWPDMKITQPQLAMALGGNRPLSVPLISSYESATNPKIPPYPRIEAYATLFATRRSLEGGTPHLLRVQDLTDDERRAMDELKRELTRLRNNALRLADPAEPDPTSLIAASLNSGPWRFDDGDSIMILCAQLPDEMLKRMPYTDPRDPDYIALYSFSDLDALVELHGHLRATNPTNQVDFRTANQLPPDAYTAHLVVLGGTDWNAVTRSIIGRMRLPIRQVADWSSPDGQYFEVEKNGRPIRHRPRLEQSDKWNLLREDVALFARATNPFNRTRTITVCNGMYGSGNYGAVRALTDARFRDRNAEYLRSRFGGSDSYCILTRVQVENGAALTPDWTIPDNRLFEWSRTHDADD
ncbi:MAG TPA: hypothetical protein VEM58_01510 [Streptosporangiaceae bacterium]|nr:hypothetical protein [Streptosporangiaceae bacterium]